MERKRFVSVDDVKDTPLNKNEKKKKRQVDSIHEDDHKQEFNPDHHKNHTMMPIFGWVIVDLL